ncbi:ATP-binding protein [Streptomyces sp. BR1]|uniref:ATP-binding protein n=1 Tax=Streptomyces sp. BR1 TaxID=1592323 RepID=UPI00402BD3C7
MFRRRLSATRRGARLARLLAVQQLHEWGVPRRGDASDTAALLVAELASNAVLHARVPGRDFELGLALQEGVLRIEVTDARGDRRLPVGTSPRDPDAVAESGRGLLLISALAARWGAEEGPVPRKTVWAEVRVLGPQLISSGAK